MGLFNKSVRGRIQEEVVKLTSPLKKNKKVLAMGQACSTKQKKQKVWIPWIMGTAARLQARNGVTSMVRGDGSP